MKISTDLYGNYNPFLINKNQKVMNTDHAAKVDTVTREEKEFFVNLYPESKNEIMDYHFYKSTGKMAGVALGTNFDKRG